jgi:hypothetical protein
MLQIADLEAKMEFNDKKLTLPDFLKLMTNNNVPIPKAMAVASKVSVLFLPAFYMSDNSFSRIVSGSRSLTRQLFWPNLMTRSFRPSVLEIKISASSFLLLYGRGDTRNLERSPSRRVLSRSTHKQGHQATSLRVPSKQLYACLLSGSFRPE